MADYIFEGTRTVAVIKDEIAFDRQLNPRYRVQSHGLLDLETDEVVAYLSPSGIPGTAPIKSGLFD